MFGYLAFFRTTNLFGIQSPPKLTNMIQMILTLKVTGIAFEINTAYMTIEKNKKLSAKTSKKVDETTELTECDMELYNINFIDLFCYSFNYIGLLTGPYYRYRTYRDYFNTPFRHYADSKNVTIKKLKWCAIYSIIHVITGYIWPINYAMEAEFYEKCSLLYRVFYMCPIYLIFRTRLYVGLILGECVCTSAGFGAYPDESDVARGGGPRKKYLHLKRDCEKLTYNFDTVKSMDVYCIETHPTLRETVRHWNICVQYWLAMYIYKRFPSKKYRQLATFVASAFWHGFHPGFYFCLVGAAFYGFVEEIHYQMWKGVTGLKSKFVYAAFLTTKVFAYSYLTVPFILLKFNDLWRYYSSIYHLGYIYFFIMVITAILATKYKKKSE
ncbi:lysophospholipid acyltransferase 7-like [Condylostylus longicornis]|uniref:lysophospholipid acyltransferase 7-like n=1 Tax=Condylostylus longicornis TaxID=2530218 RepID=UPI00244E11B5|nr:lysophospholipid acyltransferase 7-like [Condylostylus longicornis]